MLSLIVLFFIKSKEYQIPKWAIIDVVAKGNESHCQDIEVEYLDELRKACFKNPEYLGGNERCIEVIDAFLGYKCSAHDESETMDSILSKIDNSVELLLLYNDLHTDLSIDFNKLPSKMMVIYCSLDTYYEENNLNFIVNAFSKASFKGNYFDIVHFTKQMPKNIKEDGGRSSYKFVGNIKDKVSFLSIIDCDFEIIESDLNVNALCVYFSYLKPTSEYKVKTNELISLFYTNDDFIEKLADISLIETNAFYIYDTSMYDEPLNYTIKFGENNIEIYDYDEQENTTFPSNIANIIGLVSISKITTFDANSKSKFPSNFVFAPVMFIPCYPPTALINTEDEEEGSELKLLEQFTFTIKKTGDWNGLEKLKMTIVANENVVKVDKTEMNDVADIVEKEIPTNKNSNDDEKSSNNDKKNKISTGAIIGIVVACVAVVIIIVVVVVVVKKKKVQNISN